MYRYYVLFLNKDYMYSCGLLKFSVFLKFLASWAFKKYILYLLTFKVVIK
jgi:hypothetical protein